MTSEKVYKTFEEFIESKGVLLGYISCAHEHIVGVRKDCWTAAQKATLARVEELEDKVKKALEVLDKASHAQQDYHELAHICLDVIDILKEER